MPTIRPISDLRNRTDEISRFCHERGEPIYVTKNGRSDLVVMSQAAYDRQQARLELYAKLEEAEAEAGRGDKGLDRAAMMRILRKRLK